MKNISTIHAIAEFHRLISNDKGRHWTSYIPKQMVNRTDVTGLLHECHDVMLIEDVDGLLVAWEWCEEDNN